jgi:hypothetical protein
MCKAVHVHAIQAYRGSEGTAPIIYSSDARQRFVVSHMSRPLYLLRKQPQNPLNRRLDRPQSLSGCYGTEKNLLPLLGLESQTVQPAPLSLY